MRRVLLTLSGLAAVATLLVSLKSAPGASRLPGQVAADNAAIAARAASRTPSARPSGGPSVGPSGAAGPSGAPAAGPSGAPAATKAPGATAGPGPTARGGPPTAPPKAPTTTARPATVPCTTAPNTPAGPYAIIGDAAVTEFGFVTVGILVANGRITDVIAQEMPGDEPRSVAISTKAAPTLCQRVLTAQSATVDAVSGATWTSDAYKQSLRSAMTQAGL